MPSKKQVLKNIKNSQEAKKWKLSMGVASLESGISKIAG
jgi:hypothetical protein